MGSGMKDLKERIVAARKERQEAYKQHDVMENANLGVRVAAELAGAIIVGGVLGYAFDAWFSTEPVFFLSLLFLGIITGFVNIFRVVFGMRPLADPERLQNDENTVKRSTTEIKKAPDQERDDG